MLNIIGKKIFTIYAENFCLSKPVHEIQVFITSASSQGSEMPTHLFSHTRALAGCMHKV